VPFLELNLSFAAASSAAHCLTRVRVITLRSVTLAGSFFISAKASHMAQSNTYPAAHKSSGLRWLLIGAGVVIGIAAFAFQSQWLPPAQQWLAKWQMSFAQPNNAGDAGHDETSHAAHGSPNSIELSVQARKNIGLTDDFIQPVKLQPFTRSLSVPGMVTERPGRSVVEVTAPLTGVITRIFPIEGEALEAGAKLFEMRLTHEELVQSQANLLETVAALDVVAAEVKRLEKLAHEGAIPGKRLLELNYERQKHTASIAAKRQALLLHGLTDGQVDTILEKRQLLRELSVTVPTVTEEGTPTPEGTIFQVQSIKVAQGQAVEAGTTLAALADHEELYIEGEAFERDVADINRAATERLPVTAVLETDGAHSEIIENLQVLYLATKIEPQNRTLHFYVTLPNQPQRDSKRDGRRFFAWKYRPGQRVQLEIPLDTLANRIVLPIDAIAQDGSETYVFTPNGSVFERRSVHVEYRDTRQAVIVSDGSLFPGDRVALTGAQQLQVAIKNKSGGAIDPHAGHSH
jgi:membrane fusion protein, heavy metal efflux system